MSKFLGRAWELASDVEMARAPKRVREADSLIVWKRRKEPYQKKSVVYEGEGKLREGKEIEKIVECERVRESKSSQRNLGITSKQSEDLLQFWL